MNINEILNSKKEKISIGITNYDSILEVEDILIKFGYRWRGGKPNEYHFRNNEERINHLIIIYLNSEDQHYDYKYLTYSPYVDHDDIKRVDILINEYTMVELKRYFRISPNYEPRKVTKEI